MKRYIAFLRAINVGGHNVKMDELKAIFETIGFGNVETFIASGNVIFDADLLDEDELELKIESELTSQIRVPGCHIFAQPSAIGSAGTI